MIKRRSFIVGIKSITISIKERKFLKQYKPWGVILFSRNIKSVKQTKKLTNDIKKIFNDKKYPIFVDQEGGRVNRFKSFLNVDQLTGEFFGDLYKKNPKKFIYYYKLFVDKTSTLLRQTGININTVPILDLRIKGSSKIISDRSFSNNPKIVNKIGNFCIKFFHQNNIATVIKHIPGHGLATVDSHLLTPVVKSKLSNLIKRDFSTFKNKKSFCAMTAHIIYSDIDRKFTTTHSKKVIRLIRNKIKFKGLLISDDISMKSLKYPVKENTIRAFKAGCNLVLHCNSKFKEMLDVANNSPIIDDFIIKKTSQLYKILR